MIVKTRPPCPLCGYKKLNPFYSGWIRWWQCVMCLMKYLEFPNKEYRYSARTYKRQPEK